MNYVSILQQYFGYPDFRGIQREIVESIGAGRDTLGLMPTGGGKSVTFQVPALAQDGVCIVVTPLIALMKDQVVHLHQKGILAAYINSSMDRRSILQTLDNAVYGGVKFLYISPERIATQAFQTKVKHMNVCFIAVDEAHCISQWGYDFRPSYLRIAELRDLLPDVPILALTATATPEVIEDIQRQLRFREPNVYRMSFRRDNLIYVTRKTEDKLTELIHILRSVKGSAIVYMRNREGTKDTARYLCENGESATFYHAGLDFAVKDKRQQDWQEDRYRVMVATNAFGMGIDKPNVRLVIHLDSPDSLEAYFQEAGRGGRDGKRSYAVMLYNARDTSSLLVHVRNSFPEKDYVRKVYDHLAYYFQLAINSGEGASYDFSLEKFCYTFKHFPNSVLASINILQRAGYLVFNPDSDNHPRVQFLLSRDQLYRLENLSPNEDKVIEALLRKYGNLFADLAYIELGMLSQFTGLNEDQVITALKSLSHFHILKYIPRRDVPRIVYLQQRIDSSRLRFNKSIYEDLKEKAENRANAVLNYLNATQGCRSQLLLKYFGEDSEPCRCCDLCNAQREHTTGTAILDACKTTILSLLSENASIGVPINNLRNLNYPTDILEEALKQLHDNEEIKLHGSTLFLP